MNASSPERVRVLVVDDHRDTGLLMARVLGLAGHAVAAVNGCEPALAAARSGRYDVLVCDVGLPDGDGCDLLAEVRKLYPAVRAVAVTGYDQDRQRCAEAGFDRFLVKPVAFEALTAVVEELAGDAAGPRADQLHVPPAV